VDEVERRPVGADQADLEGRVAAVDAQVVAQPAGGAALGVGSGAAAGEVAEPADGCFEVHGGARSFQADRL
jgi:hypothetical protein